MESGCFQNAPQREQRISFLTEFLNDTEVRTAHDADGHPESSGPYSGPYAGFMFPRLEVRDYAALQIAEISVVRRSGLGFEMDTAAMGGISVSRDRRNKKMIDGCVRLTVRRGQLRFETP